jgi:cell wall-associated NlpC family hydrolase
MRIGKNGIAVLLLGASVATGASGVSAASAASSGSGSAVSAGTGRAGGTASASAAAAVAIGYAEKQLGKPYLWGGTGPGAFDCSGLTYMAWLQAGVSIGRTSQQQWADLPHISEQDLQPGDLVFYAGALEPGEAPPGHVAMYIGGGQILEAYATGYPIRITALRPGAWGFARP